MAASDMTAYTAAAILEAIRAGDAIVCHARCWSCQFDEHYDPPQHHIWADGDDIDHARATGQPKPTGRCGCWCAVPTEEPTP